jgi:paraquat-inducible protein B
VGAGIIGLLEVVEADFSKTLADIVSAEESAAAAYDQVTKDNAIEKTATDQDVKYKVQESMNLNKATAEATSDRSGVQAEMGAVLEYLASLRKQCDEVAETYAERKRRREAELACLKEALTTLEGEAVLLQKGVVKGAFRGVRAHGRAA